MLSKWDEEANGEENVRRLSITVGDLCRENKGLT